MSTRLYFAAVFGIWAFTVGLISLTGFLFTNDGPCHLFGAFVGHEYGDETLNFAKYYLLNSPPSSRGFIDIFGVFYPLTRDWMFSYQATVIVCVTAWFVGVLSFAWVCSGGGRWPHLLLATFSFQTAYMLGFFPFMLGVSLAFLGFALWLHFEPKNPVVAVLSAAIVFFFASRCHVFGAGVVGLVLAADALSRGWKTTALASIIGLPVIGVGLQLRRLSPDWTANFAPFPVAITRLPDSFIPGPLWKTWPVLLLVLYFFYRAGKEKNRPVMLFSGFICVLLTLALPRDFLSWEFASWRFLPVGCVVGLALAPDARATALKAVVCAIVTLQLGWSAWFLNNQQEANAPVVAALQDIKPDSRYWFPVIRYRPTKMPYLVSPYMHLGQLITMKTGGAVFYGQSLNPVYHTVLLQDGPVIPEDADTHPRFEVGEPGDRLLEKAMARASRFDGIIYYGYPGDLPFLIKAGFHITFQRDRLILGDFVGCPLNVQVDNVSAPVDVDVGFSRATEPVSTFHLEPGDQRSHTLTIDRFLCGERWVRVHGATQGCEARGEGSTVVCTVGERPSAEGAPVEQDHAQGQQTH